MRNVSRFLLGFLLLHLAGLFAHAAGFTIGNLVLVRVGTGSDALSPNGNAVFLDEYSPAGALVQSIPLPALPAGANHPFTLDGTAVLEGALGRSTDGRYLVLTGYATSPGAPQPLQSYAASSVGRAIARIDGGGSIDTSTRLTDYASLASPRSGTSTDGAAFWIVGSSGVVRHATLGATTSNEIAAAPADLRVAELCVGQLYVSTTSGALRIGVVGTVPSIAAGATITPLPGFPTTGSPNGFFLLDLDATVAGADTLYVADDVAGAIQKYALVAGSWTARGSVSAPGARGLAAAVAGGTVSLYATAGSGAPTGGGTLFRFDDTTGYNGTIAGTATTLATAAANTAFRGVAIAPVAAPTLLAQPVPLTRTAGGGASFTVNVSGSNPLTYQWRKDGVPLANGPRISGATSVFLDLSSLTASDAGDYDVVVTNPVFSVTSNVARLTIVPAVATVTLGNLSAVYTGAPIAASATTSPAGLPVTLTYNGSATAPTTAGSYTVVATINHPDYSGSATGTLTIAKAPATVALGNLSRTFNGSTHAVTATTTPAGLPVSLTYNGGAAPPLAPGTYTVVATVNDANYAGSATGTLTIARTAAIVTLLNLDQVYDGSPRVVTATSSAPGGTVTVLYNGSPTPPTNAGSYQVTATLNSPFDSGSAVGTLVVAKASQSVTLAGAPAEPRIGSAFPLSASATSGLPVALSLVSGNATLSGSSLTLHDTSPVTVRATQSGNENVAPASAELTLTAAKQSQTITFAAPADRSADAAPFALVASASSGLPVTFSIVSGPASVSGSTVTLDGNAGTVVVRASQPGNATFAAAAPVERSFVVTSALLARLVNFSTRATAGSGEQVVIVGFVISGSEPKPVLVRAIGPTLRAFGVSTALAAPRLELWRGSTSLAANAGWSTSLNAAEIAAAAARSGAFPLASGSADAVILTTLAPGAYTAIVTAASGPAGASLVEVYDLSSPTSAGKLTNLSTRALVGAGDNTFITGLVVEGNTPRRFLVRAAGPALTQFGVPNALTRPELTLRSTTGDAIVAQNAGWASAPDAAAIAAAGAAAGAFPFAANSQDAALIATLPPGSFTIQVTGVGGAGGVTLFEAYELP